MRLLKIFLRGLHEQYCFSEHRVFTINNYTRFAPSPAGMHMASLTTLLVEAPPDLRSCSELRPSSCRGAACAPYSARPRKRLIMSCGAPPNPRPHREGHAAPSLVRASVAAAQKGSRPIKIIQKALRFPFVFPLPSVLVRPGESEWRVPPTPPPPQCMPATPWRGVSRCATASIEGLACPRPPLSLPRWCFPYSYRNVLVAPPPPGGSRGGLAGCGGRRSPSPRLCAQRGWGPVCMLRATDERKTFCFGDALDKPVGKAYQDWIQVPRVYPDGEYVLSFVS